MVLDGEDELGFIPNPLNIEPLLTDAQKGRRAENFTCSAYVVFENRIGYQQMLACARSVRVVQSPRPINTAVDDLKEED